MKKVLCLILLMATLLIMATPTGSVTAESVGVASFDETYVLDDLTSAVCNGMKFNPDDYPKDSSAEPKILSFQEYAYSYYASEMSSFGLYLYVYNPSGKLIDTKSKSTITIAVSYDEEGKPCDYEKFKLEVCSRSAYEYSNLFYKFKVIDHISLSSGKTIKQRVSASPKERRYDVSEIELDMSGSVQAFGVGGTFKFSGYAKGLGKLGETEESTLNCVVDELETVTLDVHPVIFRTGVYDGGSSHPDDNHRYQINSVYFSVDNRLLEEYGKLQKIKAEWWEYNTKPIFVTDNLSLYNSLKSWIGKNIGNYNNDVPYSLMFGMSSQSGSKRALYGYNVQTDAEGGDRDIEIVSERINQLAWLFLSNTEDMSVSETEIIDYYKSYGGGENIPGTNYSSDLFINQADNNRTAGYNSVNVDSNDLFNLISYDENHNWWDKFVDFGFSIPDTGESYKGVKPIEKIEMSMFEGDAETVSKTILVDESYIDELKKYVSSEGAKDKSVYIFRFAVTDYYTFEANYVRDNNAGKLVDSRVYFAEQTAFLDFDIIQLTFNKDGAYTVIPVVASPVDIISGIEPPPDSELEEALKDAKEWFEKIWEKITAALGDFKSNWWKYLLCAAGIAIAFAILPTIVRIILWLIKQPFEAVERSIKKKKR